MNKEIDHIRLCKELGNSRQFISANFIARLIHLFLPLTLPELVDPSEGVAGFKDIWLQVVEQLLQLQLIFVRKSNLQHRVIRAKDLRQHLLGKTAGQGPKIGTFLLGQFLTLFQTNGHPHLRLDEEVIFRQETGKEHPMPVLVSTLLNQMRDLQFSVFVLLIPQLPRPGTKVVAKQTLFWTHMAVRLVMMHSQGLQGRLGSGFGNVPGFDDCTFKFISLFY